MAVTLINGYDRNKRRTRIQGTPAAPADILNAPRDAFGYVRIDGRREFWFRANDGTARRARVNGKLRTWKRQPERFELPCKYGMYECHTFTEQDCSRILLNVKELPAER